MGTNVLKLAPTWVLHVNAQLSDIYLAIYALLKTLYLTIRDEDVNILVIAQHWLAKKIKY